MQTIVVPTDFSNEARNAGLYAAELAKVFSAKLLLFHAYMLPTPVSEVPYVMITVDELQKENEILIRKEVDHLSRTYGVPVEGIVRIGIPSDEIRALTEDLSIELVVMGMKGAHEQLYVGVGKFTNAPPAKPWPLTLMALFR